MIQTKEEINVLALEEEFYSKPFYFSYSGLNRLLYSPKLFYSHYVLQQREEKLDSYLIEGKVIHCLLLDNENFEKQFVVSPVSLPSDNPRIVVDRIFKYAQENNLLDQDLRSFELQILEVLKEINLYQSLKTDEQRIEKLITDQTVSYFDFLIEKGKKDVIDTETYSRCLESVQILRQNLEVVEALDLYRKSGGTVYSEHPIQINLPGYPFGLKGIVDNIVVDETNKTVIINDLKTTGKTVSEFPETVEYYKYWLQAAVYKVLVLNGLPGVDSSWSVKFNFIVIDKYKQTYVFPVSDETMDKVYSTGLGLTLDSAKYHYEQRDYSLPYDMLTRKVTL
jgi:hypothetical protein